MGTVSVSNHPKPSKVTEPQKKIPNTCPQRPMELTPSEALKQTRNEIQKMNKVRSIMSKLLKSQLTNHDSRRSWLVSTLVGMMAEDPKPMNQCNLQFSISDESLAHNDMIFQQNDFDYSKVVNSNPNSIITPGIEFRQKETLHRLWQYHKDWTLISDIIFQGVDYPCKSAPSEEERLSDLEFMIN